MTDCAMGALFMALLWALCRASPLRLALIKATLACFSHKENKSIAQHIQKQTKLKPVDNQDHEEERSSVRTMVSGSSPPACSGPVPATIASLPSEPAPSSETVVCQHINTSHLGSNQYQTIKRCKDCGRLLEFSANRRWAPRLPTGSNWDLGRGRCLLKWRVCVKMWQVWMCAHTIIDNYLAVQWCPEQCNSSVKPWKNVLLFRVVRYIVV